MANSNNIYSSFISNVQIIIKFLFFIQTSLFLIISPVCLYAQTPPLGNINGWNVTSAVRNGASTTYNAVKNLAGGLTATSTAVLLPTASQLLKSFGGGLAVAGAIYAVEKLLPAGKQWIDDLAHSQIKYLDTSNQNPEHPEIQYRWKHSTYGTYIYGLSGATIIANLWIADLQQANPIQFSYLVYTSCNWGGDAYNSAISCIATRTTTNDTYNLTIPLWDTNPAYNPNYIPPNPIERTIPYLDIANEILNDANNGLPIAVDILGGVSDSSLDPSKQYVPSQILANQFAKNAVYPSDTTVSGNTVSSGTITNPASSTNAASQTVTTNNSSTTMELPKFCKYASSLCDFLSWTQEEPEINQDKNKVDTDDTVPAFTPLNINFNGYCPPPYSISFNLYGNSFSFDMPYQPLCDLLLIIRPFVIASAYITSAYIIIGLRG